MYRTTGSRGNLFTFILNDEILSELKKNKPVCYDMVISSCIKILNLLDGTPKVSITTAFVQLDYEKQGHVYTCMIKNSGGKITVLIDNEIVEADVGFVVAAEHLVRYLTRASEAAIIETKPEYSKAPVQRTSEFVAPTKAPAAETRKKIKISITYTREVSIGDSSFSSVMDQVGKLCEAQPQSLNCGFVLSDTNIAIADN